MSEYIGGKASLELGEKEPFSEAGGGHDCIQGLHACIDACGG